MKPRPTIALAALLALAALALHAPGQYVDVRISVKIILNPTNNAFPPNITGQLFTNAVDAANGWMETYGRGYRYVLSEVVPIGGTAQGGTNGPSRWFGLEFRGGAAWSNFYSLAQSDHRYLLRTNQINVWVATAAAGPGDSGGAMPIPPDETATIGGQIYADDGPWWVVHELGHFFGLYHTFGNCRAPGCTFPSFGDDGIADTLPEGSNYTPDQIAQTTYSNNYASLTAHQKWMVDNTYFNVMSYHEATNKNVVMHRMTELQLDSWTYYANFDRNPFVSGRTRFVSPAGNNANNGLDPALPKRTVSNAVAAPPGGGDVLMIRHGTYNEQLTIDKPVTLRTPRYGTATIGAP